MPQDIEGERMAAGVNLVGQKRMLCLSCARQSFPGNREIGYALEWEYALRKGTLLRGDFLEA